MRRWLLIATFLFLLGLTALPRVFGAPGVPAKSGSRVMPEEMEVQIKGQFKGRLLIKRIVAPVSMNLEKLQDFPEDPSQKILVDPLPISQSADFNGRHEVKGHAPFWPWIPPIPEAPFLTIVPPKGLPVSSWMFEVLNPEGRTIYRQRSTHAMPDELIWEGKDSEMQFAVVDRLYAAQLTVMGLDGKVTIIPGSSIILPMLAYNSDKSQTIEVSLARLFNKGTAEISPEGALMVSKICESMRERGLTRAHIRIAEKDTHLATAREVSLVQAMQKTLHLPLTQLEHDHLLGAGQRGEVASFWLKIGG